MNGKHRGMLLLFALVLLCSLLFGTAAQAGVSPTPGDATSSTTDVITTSATSGVPEADQNEPLPVAPDNQEQCDVLGVDLFRKLNSAANDRIVEGITDSIAEKSFAKVESYLNTAEKYGEAYARSGNDKNLYRLMRAEDAASSAKIKGLGVKGAGKAFGVYCIGKNVAEYLEESNHGHSSLALVDQSLRGFDLVSSSLDCGGMKLAKPLAIVGGVVKDLFGGKVFANWCNKSQNGVLTFFDQQADVVNTTAAEISEPFFGIYYIIRQLPQDGSSTRLYDPLKIYGKPPAGAAIYMPNIYLYPDETTEISLAFGLPALIAASDPEYRNG